jgi:hypothetical protein
MGHTTDPKTMQFERERQYLAGFVRGLLLKHDQMLMKDLLDRVAFHIPAMQMSAHPLPIATILLGMHLEQEKTIYDLQQRLARKEREEGDLEKEVERLRQDLARMSEGLERLRGEMNEDIRLARNEFVEMLHPEWEK